MKVKLKDLKLAIQALDDYKDEGTILLDLHIVEENLQKDILCSSITISRTFEEEAQNYGRNTKYIKKIRRSVEIYPGENQSPTQSTTETYDLN